MSKNICVNCKVQKSVQCGGRSKKHVRDNNPMKNKHIFEFSLLPWMEIISSHKEILSIS